MREDLERQRQLAERASNDYESELIKHAKDVELLTTTKNALSMLQLKHASLRLTADAEAQKLVIAENSWNEQRGLLEQQVKHAEQRVSEFTSQNALLHSQLESLSAQIAKLQKPLMDAMDARDDQSDAGDNDAVQVAMKADMKTIEELREVISFLRREKEVLEYEKVSNMQESRRLQAQFSAAQRALDDARAQLTDAQFHAENGRVVSNTEFEELSSKSSQADLLRSSNIALRDEITRARDRIAYFERTTQEISNELNPVRDQLRKVSSELEVRQNEIKLLEEDNTRWKNRTQQILSKYDKIDPAEHKELQESYEKLRQDSTARIEALTKSLADKDAILGAHNAVTTRLQKAIDELTAKNGQLDARAKALQAELDQAKSTLSVLTAEKEELATSVRELTAQEEESRVKMARVNEVSKKYKNRISEVTQRTTEALQVIEQLKAEHQVAITELESKHEVETANYKRTVESKQKLSENMSQNKLRRAEVKNAELEATIAQLEARIVSLAEQIPASTEQALTPALMSASVPPASPPSNKRRHVDNASPASANHSVPPEESELAVAEEEKTAPPSKKVRIQPIPVVAEQVPIMEQAEQTYVAEEDVDEEGEMHEETTENMDEFLAETEGDDTFLATDGDEYFDENEEVDGMSRIP